ncbi:microtubule-associated protein 4-like isoform X3 [Scleropages formosus]|uniref:microtubule-associated protein 4-like isoform X3 n=1 Tax=Scleropages formosus TaxID=113540 RepID=UPI0010FA97FF|nr:microtubule-associated protein 4-like isoform X3 [Scleropages formosus]
MDLSLSNALKDAPPPQPESLVQRDFIATLEAQAFEDKVGETVGKSEYRPLLDVDGSRADPVVMPGGQTAGQYQQPQGDMWTHPMEQQIWTGDLLSGIPPPDADPWGSLPSAPHTDTFTGLSQTGMPMNMDVGVAPLPTAKPPSMPEPQKANPPLAPEPPDQPQMPNQAREQNAQDSTAAHLGGPWVEEGGPPADVPFGPGSSAVFGLPSPRRQMTSPKEDCEGDVSDRKQQRKKKKKRPKEEPYDFIEDRGPLEALGAGDEHIFPSDIPNPYRDVGWHGEEGGRGVARGKKSKIRKKIPEEWSTLQESPVPSATAEPQERPEDLLTGLGPQPMENSSPGTVGPVLSTTLSPEEGLKALSHVDMSVSEQFLIDDDAISKEFSFLPSDPVTPDIPPSPMKDFPCLIPASSQPGNEPIRNTSNASSPKGSLMSNSAVPSCPPPPKEPSVSAAMAPAPTEEKNLPLYTCVTPNDDATHTSTKDASSSPAEVALSPEAEPYVLPCAPAPLSSSVTARCWSNRSEEHHVSTSPPQLTTSVRSPTCRMPPAASPLVSSTSPIPPGSSGLNPAAPPFFPSFMEYQTPQLQGWSEEQVQAGPSTLEVVQPEKADTFEKTDNSQMVEKIDALEKMDKPEKTDKPEKVDKSEKIDKDENSNKVEKVEKSDQIEKLDKEKEKMAEKVEKDKEKVDMAEKVEKEKEKIDKAEKMDKEKTDKTEKVDKGKEKMDKKEKPNKAEKARKADSSEKPDKTAKVEKAEKAVKEPGKTALANGTGAAPGKGLSAADKKAKPTTGLTKATSAKTRPNSLSTGDATPKGPPPASNSSSATLNKKSPVSKATTPTTGTKRPGPTANRSLSATEPREVKAKTTDGRTTERLPPVPKANATPPARASVTKNGSPTTAAAKPAGAPRATPVPRTSTSAPSLRRTTPAKSESKAGEAKKPSTLKTTTDSSRPRTTPTRTSSTAPGTPGAAPGSTKPAVSNAAVPERKPPVPRAPRAAPRPGTAPPPDIKNVRSKIGSTDNMKHQPGGGKVSTSQGRTDTLAKGSLCKETSQGKVQIVSKKLDFSHVTSRCGSKDNIKHVPGGGHIQIRNKKVDLSKVTSKCGSKANIKHKPGGGDVKIESHKIKIKAQSKVGSMDNMNHNPGGGNVKAEGLQETAEGNVAPAIGTLPTLAGSVARENGLKEGVACRGEGLRDPQGLDTHIPETN